MSTLSAANAVITLSISTIFPSPVTLKQWSSDEVYSSDDVEITEALMGVDGVQSAGFVWVAVKQSFMFQANSPSTSIFDQWISQMQQAQDVYYASGTLSLNGLGQKWSLVSGTLLTGKILPDVGKLVKPRKFTISWERVLPQNVLAYS